MTSPEPNRKRRSTTSTLFSFHPASASRPHLNEPARYKPRISLLSYSDVEDDRPSYACSEDLAEAAAAALAASSDIAATPPPESRRQSIMRRVSSLWSKFRRAPQGSPRPSEPEVLSSDSELEIEVMELDDVIIERDWYYRRLLGIETMSTFAKDWCRKNPGHVEFEAFLDSVTAQLYCD